MRPPARESAQLNPHEHVLAGRQAPLLPLLTEPEKRRQDELREIIRMKTTNPHPFRVLLADDQVDIRDALRLLLKREGYETQAVASPAEALAAIEAREFDAVLMDLNYARDTTSGQEGLDLLTNI